MWLVQFYRSTIGKKIIMAVTGLIGIGFVIGHMAGNLQAFVGRDDGQGQVKDRFLAARSW